MIFLIGMPGSGKTYWANKIAKEYNIKYIDLDELIEKREGVTVSKIFDVHGEEHFRVIEHNTLLYLTQNHNEDKTVVACGGGTPVFNNNLQLMKENGCVVYLNVDTDTINSRLHGEEKDERPLLAIFNSIKEVLDNILEKRKPIYEQAHYILNGDQISLNSFKPIINSCTNRH